MLYLKMMQSQDFPDSNPCNDYSMYAIPDHVELHFSGDVLEGAQVATVTATLFNTVTNDRKVLHLNGTAYVMNEQGKTISSRAAY